LTFLGDFQSGRVKEASLRRSLVVDYVRQLFKRSDFPQEIFIVLADSTVANKGDVVWGNIDSEHPYDFVPMPCIDQLVSNLPSKNQFLQAVGANSLEEVSAEAERAFWKDYQFDFSENADGVKLIWQ